jgi:hypothetical protein
MGNLKKSISPSYSSAPSIDDTFEGRHSGMAIGLCWLLLPLSKLPPKLTNANSIGR